MLHWTHAPGILSSRWGGEPPPCSGKAVANRGGLSVPWCKVGLVDDWIERTARAISVNHSDDLAQEARISLWREYGHYHEHAAKNPLRLRMLDLVTGVRGWTGQDRPRRYGRAVEYATEVLPQGRQPVDPDLRLDVERALARLTPAERRYIYCKYYLQMTWPEIEQVFCYAPQVLWRRARDKLRAELAHLKER